MDLKQIERTLFGDDTEQVNKGIGYQPPQQLQLKIITSEEVDSITDEASSLHGVPKQLIRAIIDNESDRTPDGKYIASGKSRVAGHPSSATGLMQLIDSTAKSMGVEDATDPKQNVMGGAKYLRSLMDRYNGDQEKALAAYFKGPKTVDEWLKQNPDVKQLPGDTGGTTVADYIGRVSKNIQKYGGKLEVSSTSQLAPDDINNPDYLAKILFGEVEPQQNQPTPAQMGQTQRAEPFALPDGQQPQSMGAPEQKKQLPFLGDLIELGKTVLRAPVTSLKGKVESLKGSTEGSISQREEDLRILKAMKESGVTLRPDNPIVQRTVFETGEPQKFTGLSGQYDPDKIIAELESNKQREEKNLPTLQKIIDVSKSIENSGFLKKGEVQRMPGVGGVAQDVTSALGQVASNIGLAAINPSLAAASMITMIDAGTLDKLEEKGISEEDRAALGLLNAALQYPLEKLGLEKITKGIDFKSAAGSVIKRIATSMGAEGVTEALQEIPDYLITEFWTENKDKDNLEKFDALIAAVPEMAKQAGYSGAIGAVTGGMATGAGIGVQKLMGRDIAPEEQQTPSTIAEQTQPQQFDIVDEKGNVIPGAGRNEPPPIADDNPLIGAGRIQEPVVSPTEIADVPSVQTVPEEQPVDAVPPASTPELKPEVLPTEPATPKEITATEEQLKSVKEKASGIEGIEFQGSNPGIEGKNKKTGESRFVPPTFEFKDKVSGGNFTLKEEDVTPERINIIVEGLRKNVKPEIEQKNPAVEPVEVKPTEPVSTKQETTEKPVEIKTESKPVKFSDWHKEQEEKYGLTKNTEVTYNVAGVEKTGKFTGFTKSKTGEAKARISIKTDTGYSIASVSPSTIKGIKTYEPVLEQKPEEIKKEVLSYDRPPEVQKEVEQVNVIPTDAQKEAGNYKKGHIKLSGMDVSIENPAGSERRGKSPEGKEWSSKINHDYGYIRGTKGADAYRGNNTDQLDVFMNPGIKEDESRDVFIVNQKDPKTGKFDEHKIMVGFTNKNEAAKAYLSNYEKGWKGMKSIVRMPMDKFKEWAYSDQTQYELKENESEQDIISKMAEPIFIREKYGDEIVRTPVKEYTPYTIKNSKHDFVLVKKKDTYGEWISLVHKKTGLVVTTQKDEVSLKKQINDAIKQRGIEWFDKYSVDSNIERLKGKEIEATPEMADLYFKEGFHPRSYIRLEEGIKNKDADILESVLHLKNKKSRELFTKKTGVELPKTMLGTVSAIRDFIGKEVYDKGKAVAKEEAIIKEEEAKTKKYNTERDKLLDAKVPGQPGSTYRTLIDNHAKAGYSVKVDKVGIREVYKLVKAGEPVSTILPKKMIGEYALEKMPKYVEPAKSEFDTLTDDLREIDKEIAKEKQFNKKVELNKKYLEIINKLKKLDTGKEMSNEKEDSKKTETLLKQELESNIRKPTEIPEAIPESFESVPEPTKELSLKERAAKKFAEKQAARNKPEESKKGFGLHLIKNPGGTYSFVGTVPADLMFEEGATQEQINNAKQFGERFGPKKRIFKTSEEALAVAKEKGYKVEDNTGERPSTSEKIAEETVKRDEALDRATNLLKKLGESFVKRDPNTMYSIGTEQAELAFEAVSALVEAGYREFKIITLKVKEIAGAYIDNKNFQNAIEDAFDSYQEEDTTIPKRTDTIENILSQEVKDGRKDDIGTLEKVEPKSTKGSDSGTTANEGTGSIEKVPGSIGDTGKSGINDGRGERDLPGDSISESGGERVTAEPKKRDNSRNYIIDDSDNIGEGSVVTKAKQTLDAIKLLKSLEEKNKKATKEEQAILAKFAGWGPLSGALVNEESDVSYQWKEVHRELKKLLTEEEFKAAKEASINAHYTAPSIIRKMWDAVTKMGIKSGNVLEPAVGIGTFFGLRPAKSKFNMVAVEMDSLSARMAQQLYQGAEVNHSPYQNYFLPKNYFDLAISNVPFAKIPIFDENAKLYGIKNNQSVHNFYFAKTMHGIKPGGIMAFITSRYTLDAVDNLDVMKAITSKGNIVGAIRLPRDAFKGVANTEVVTDIIFVQKRADGEPESPMNNAFKEKTKITLKDRMGKEISYNINSYFAQNPIMVVGDHSSSGTMYSANEYSVVSKETFDSDLDIAFSNLPKNIATDYDAKYRKSLADTIAAPSDITIGAHFIGPDGEVYMKKQSLDQPRPIGAKTNLSSKDKEIFKKLINLRTLARALFKKQIATNESIDADLKEINNAYDSFVKENGTLHSKSNVSLIGRDSDLSVVMAMENNDGTKGDFLLKRIVKESTAISKVDTAEDAYILSLTEKGGIDFEYMSKISGKSINEIRTELETTGLVFEDPDSFLRGNKATYLGREEYLSGNVRLKLKQAIAAAEKEPKFSNNVAKLREIQPQDKGPGEITILPNNPILQEIDIGYFMAEVMIKSKYGIDVKHDRQQGKWTVVAEKRDPNNVSYGVNYSEEAGGGGVALYGHEILQNILNNRPSEVKYTVKEYDSVRTYTDTAATAAAKAKESQIKEEFKKWIWTNPERTDRIVKEFNDRFNCYQDRDYTHPARIKNKAAAVNPVGSTISLRPHQANAVWRAVQTQNVLFAHEVGAGKTYACIATAMEKKRLGLCKKSMIVVPNHLADQWGNDIISAYPGAKILVGNEQNFKASERKEFINKAAFGDYDIIVMRYSHFKKISVNPNIEAAYIQERINALEDALQKQQAINKSGRGSRSSTKDEKDLIKKINSYKAKIFALTNVQRDVGIPYFDELGVDQIFVDEADNFKNLEYVSSIKKVLGMGNQAGSQQATDLIMKTRFIQKEGGGVVFATGTPVKNSLVEAYHMMRYLQPDYLKDNMLENFDEWQRVFAEPVTSFEQTASGLVQRTRFTKYNNVQELMAALRETWDIIDSQYLEDNKILVKGVNLPNVNRNVVEVNMSPVLEDYMEHLADRERSVKGKPPEKGGDNIMVIMMHGKLASTDIRTINKKAPKETNSKLTKVIDKAFDLYNKYSDKTGIIFYDQTAPKKGVKNSDRIGIEVLTEIKDQLVFRGVNPNDIAMIHEYAKKDLPKLKEAMDSGKKRILLGNTHRMGAGTNVQKKLKWEFHIDAPHRPGDITQREGRIIRQGNTNKDIEIYTFVTKGSFDATAWEMLNKKAKMIGSIMNGRDRKTNSFEEEDQFDQASIAALSNPLMMQRADLNQKIKELEGQAENLDTEIYKAKKVIKEYDFLKGAYTKEIASQKMLLKDNPPQPDGDKVQCTVNGVEFTSRKDAAEAVKKGISKGVMILKYGNISYKFLKDKDDSGEAWFEYVDFYGNKGNEVLNKSRLFINISKEYEKVNATINRLNNSLDHESKKLAIAQEKSKESTQPLRDKISELKTKLADVIKEIEIYNAQKAAEKAARPAGEGVNWYALEEERKSQDVASEEDIEEENLDGNEENEDNKPEETEKEDFSIPLEYEGYLEGIKQAPEKEQFSVPLSPEPAPMPVKSIIETTKNAPHGKKVEYAVASNKIGKQMVAKKTGRGLSFLDAKNKFYQKFVDLTWPISQIEDQWADDIGADRKKIRTIDIAISKVRGAGGMAKQFIEDNMTSILNTVPWKIRSKVYTELNKYLIAKRTVWLYENKDSYIDAGISVEDARSLVEFVETGAHSYSEEINRIAPRMWEFNKKLLQVKRDHGVIDDELLSSLAEPYYVPFYRDVDENTKLNIPKGEKYTNIGKGIKRLQGSTSGAGIIEPLQNMMQNSYETFVNAYRADVMNKIIDFAESSPELGKMFEKVPPKWVKVGTIEYRGEVDMILRPKLKEFANKLGITVEEKPKVAGFVGGKMKKILGKSAGNKIELMIGATESQFSHELGHQLHKKYSKWVDPFIDGFVDELNEVADTRYLGLSVPASYVSYCRNRNEKFAEFVSMYITDRENLQTLAPNAFMEFETRIALDNNLRELIGFKPSNVSGIMTKGKDNWVQDWHVPQDREVVSVLREGKIVSYRCPVEVADAIKNMHPAMFPTWFRIFTLPMRILRKGAVTLNIGFIFPNSVRDNQESAFNAGTIPVYDFLIGLKEYITNGDMYKQYYRLGGGMDSVESGTRRFEKSVDDLKYGSKYGKFLDQMYWNQAGVLKGTLETGWAVLTSPFDLISKMGEASEMASRIGTYRRAVVGMPEWLKWYNNEVHNADEAIHIARQATVDFQRFGSYGRTANELIPFINAAIQGYDKMIRTVKDDPRRALLAAVLYVFGPMMAFWLWNKDKEGYKAVPLQDKINNFIIMNPDEKSWIKIPKGHIVKFIGNPVQVTMEKIYGTVLKSDASIIKQVLSDVSPIDISSIPVSLRLIIEPIANYDLYWNREIEKPYQKAILQAGLRSDKKTAEAIKVIGKALNISPIMMQHEIEIVGAGTAKNILWLADMAMGKIDPTRFGLEKMPVTRSFYGKIGEWGTDIDSAIIMVNKELAKTRSFSIKKMVGYSGYTPEEIRKVSKANVEKIKLLYEKRSQLMKASEAIKHLRTTEE